MRGLRQLSYALEDVLRATEEGIRSFLVADLGLLRAVNEAQARGALPAGLIPCRRKAEGPMARETKVSVF